MTKTHESVSESIVDLWCFVFQKQRNALKELRSQLLCWEKVGEPARAQILYAIQTPAWDRILQRIND